MNEQSSHVHRIAAAAILGAAYAVLTMSLAPISYGPLQFRVSEALCILPFFLPFTAWGLFAGCIMANILTGNIFDIIFGSLATLFAGLLIARLGRGAHTVPRQLLACFMPVIFNAVIVGAVITAAYEGQNIFRHFGLFLLNAGSVGLGEAAVLYLIGFPLMRALPGMKFFREWIDRNSQE